MKKVIPICFATWFLYFVACTNNSDSDYSTAPKEPSYYCSLNGITYQSESAYNSGCITSTQTYYCSLNGITYQSETAYKSGCIAPSYYCNLNGITYTDISQYNIYCVAPSSSSVQQYCCDRTGECYDSKTLYDIHCSTPPSYGSSSNSSETTCTTCECNPIYQDTYKAISKTAACSSMGQKGCQQMVANQVGCKL